MAKAIRHPAQTFIRPLHLQIPSTLCRKWPSSGSDCYRYCHFRTCKIRWIL